MSPAVKCNPEPTLLAMLAALGAGFDCASVMELEAVEVLGVSQDRIIFANPCKKPADFRYAACMLSTHSVSQTGDCTTRQLTTATYPMQLQDPSGSFGRLQTR